MTKWKVGSAFEGMSAVRFAREFMDLFDDTRLGEVKIRVSDSRGLGIHGNCKPPGYPQLTPRNDKFRISCSIARTAFNETWPLPLSRLGLANHAGTARVERVAESVNELVAFVLGHELYHYLGHKTREISGFWQAMVPYELSNGTGQIPGRSDSERRADLMGYEFLYAVREDREPLEVAYALMMDEGLVAPKRFPYTRG